MCWLASDVRSGPGNILTSLLFEMIRCYEAPMIGRCYSINSPLPSDMAKVEKGKHQTYLCKYDKQWYACFKNGSK